MATPLFLVFFYTSLYFAPVLNIPVLILFFLTPFVSHAFPEKRRPTFYFFVELIFLLAVLWVVFGRGLGGSRTYDLYSLIISAEFMLPFAFGVEILRQNSSAASMSSLLLGMGILLDEIATIAYSQAHSAPIITSYIDVWSLQITGILELLESGYQNSLPLQTLNIAASPFIVSMFIIAFAGFFLYLVSSGGRVASARVEQAAMQIVMGALVTIAILGVMTVLSGYGLALTVITACVVVVFILIVRIATGTYGSSLKSGR